MNEAQGEPGRLDPLIRCLNTKTGTSTCKNTNHNMSRKVDVEATRQETSTGLNWIGIEKPSTLLAAHTSWSSELVKFKA
jgi:hypothetical protein